MDSEEEWCEEILKRIPSPPDEEFQNEFFLTLRKKGLKSCSEDYFNSWDAESMVDYLIEAICYFEVREEYEKCAFMIPKYNYCMKELESDDIGFYVSYRDYLLMKLSKTC